MRWAVAALVVGLAACGGRETGSSTSAAAEGGLACPQGEHACGSCEGPPTTCGADCIITPPCPTSPTPPRDGGCSEGMAACEDCDGSPFCASVCPLRFCPVDAGTPQDGGADGGDLLPDAGAEGGNVLPDGGVCPPGEIACALGCIGVVVCFRVVVCPVLAIPC